ncbi:phosphotransferase family protein [Mesobacillus selenatarsenatis]|uniref:Kanamycin kinase (Aminoglycoside phosphotransferase, gentamicin resistance protein) n=1 Tax=Mesobacillus selenatarsenatis (strain DSM 18680 / JCM 14380 / FERM P-15431 / SF-1) TaxID=1321606 RepID=A0A0A8WZK1_MESS1|nr:aminoglycoside phosphotransferase family protein [Mesobacillus selenatarsenatis]GAM12192.1 kanamycin kinase (aminoglycoside phosphotransferase, gentamicin resistance protein) [Mesobacillus selenatarsenatis SF-1]
MNHKLIEQIQSEHPDLIINDFYDNEMGQNNDVIIVNESLVFRFPKYKQGIIQLRRETEILKYIKDFVKVPIPIPIYEAFDELEPGKVFTGYNLIEGNPLWRKSLLEIKSDEQLRGLASQLVSFLAALHSISGELASRELQLEASHPREEMSDLYEKIQHKLFPFMSKESQISVTESFEDFLSGEALSNLDLALIHGDFGASNILWNSGTDEISGIIDFGGSGIGDPAYDFAGLLSSYGEDFFNKCIDQYPNGKEIAKRVHFYKSTFALQEALHGIENDDEQAFEAGIRDYR